MGFGAGFLEVSVMVRSKRFRYEILRICVWRLPKSLGLQIAKSRSYFHTLGPKVGIIYILGALGNGMMLLINAYTTQIRKAAPLHLPSASSVDSTTVQVEQPNQGGGIRRSFGL